MPDCRRMDAVLGHPGEKDSRQQRGDHKAHHGLHAQQHHGVGALAVDAAEPVPDGLLDLEAEEEGGHYVGDPVEADPALGRVGAGVAVAPLEGVVKGGKQEEPADDDGEEEAPERGVRQVENVGELERVVPDVVDEVVADDTDLAILAHQPGQPDAAPWAYCTTAAYAAAALV